MNSLRTTEKGLASLAFKLKGKIPTKSPFSDRTKWSQLSNSVPRRPYSYSKRATFPRDTGSIIRIAKPLKAQSCLNKVSTHALSTNQEHKQEILSLISPNKPTPEQCKDLVVEPIRPLTLSRFPKTKTENEIPSVTKVLKETMPAASKFILDRWRESMIKKLGVDGFNQYTKDTFERGHALHSIIANYLLGMGEPSEKSVKLTKEVVSNLWKSIQSVVKENINNVRLVEHIVSHPEMNYRGIIDCVAFYKDELVVIDFKTAEKPKKDVESLYDNPLQVTAYCGALNHDKSIPNHVIDRNICSGLVIVAYVDGSPASTYYLGQDKVNDYWRQWIERLDQYNRLDEMNKASNKRVA